MHDTSLIIEEESSVWDHIRLHAWGRESRILIFFAVLYANIGILYIAEHKLWGWMNCYVTGVLVFLALWIAMFWKAIRQYVLEPSRLKRIFELDQDTFKLSFSGKRSRAEWVIPGRSFTHLRVTDDHIFARRSNGCLLTQVVLFRRRLTGDEDIYARETFQHYVNSKTVMEDDREGSLWEASVLIREQEAKGGA